MEFVLVRLPGGAKAYTLEASGIDGIETGDPCVVEWEGMHLVGEVVSARPGIVRDCCRRTPLARVLRKANQDDLDFLTKKNEREAIAFDYCRAKVEEMGLTMKLVRAECAPDGKRILFTFTSDGRVDFRALVRDLASRFHTRIEMRQIGVRDEAKMVGGMGVCGRALCCASFMKTFEPVTIQKARKQQVVINPTKISGLCGRLMCCLAFEAASRGRMYSEDENQIED